MKETLFFENNNITPLHIYLTYCLVFVDFKNICPLSNKNIPCENIVLHANYKMLKNHMMYIDNSQENFQLTKTIIRHVALKKICL